MPSYLTAGKIKEGMSGTISGEPKEEKHTFNEKEGEKTVFRLPLKLDAPIMDDYSKEQTSDWIWNAGVFARGLLEEELGEEYQSWINAHGSFKIKQWSTKTRNGFAWHFIPDTPNAVTKLVEETAKKLGELGEQDVPRQAIPIECAYCAEAGDFWSTSRPENMLAHIEKFHPEKVKDQLKAVKARVKKE